MAIRGVLSDKDIVKNAAQNALKMMRDSGYEISGSLEVMVEPEPPFMGYTTQREAGHLIVVSGMALKSGMIEGLLIHEMSHIYRAEKNHPSYNENLLDRVTNNVIRKNMITEDYQVKILQQAINHIQDLYADDIAFKVFEKSKSFTEEQSFTFFLDWIKERPIDPKSTKDKWFNIGIMLNNCFAINNLSRHNVRDIGNQAENKAQRFLSQNISMKEDFSYCKNFMIGLKENTNDMEFERDLAEYLTTIIGLVK